MSTQEDRVEINFSTENLIVTNYPALAGGKFITKILALHPMILLQHQKFAKMKMAGEQDIESCFAITKKILDAKKNRLEHVEYDDTLLADFSGNDLHIDIKRDEEKSNKLYRDLTNQKKFYFCMIDHQDGTAMKRYVNRKTLRLRNYEWIVDDRIAKPLADLPWHEKVPHLTRTYGDTYDQSKQASIPNLHHFDMSSLQEKELFKTEINKALDFIGLSEPEEYEVFYRCLEDLRKGFLDTYKIGFPWRSS